jgi:hypothetical protein
MGVRSISYAIGADVGDDIRRSAKPRLATYFGEL